MKKALLLFCMLFIIAGCTYKSKTILPMTERDLIEGNALAASKAIYSGDETYLEQVAEDENQKYFQELIDINKSVKLKKVTVHSYSKENEDTVNVTLLVEDSQGNVYHQYIFEKMSNGWIIKEFGVDI